MKKNHRTQKWVASDLQIGRIKQTHADGTIDVVIYARDGKKIGRTSPSLDGPRWFEPCCDPTNWRRIEAPEFPLSTFYYLEELVKFIE